VLPAIRARLRQTGGYPGAVALSRELLTLPTHSLVTPADVDAIMTLLSNLDDASWCSE
jgi:hypothetical protein